MSSIKVDHRESRSVLNALTAAVLNPIGDLILKPGKPFPAGSPQLTPPKAAEKRCHVHEHQVADTWLYTLSDVAASEKQHTAHIKGRIYYFAGGGFRGLPTKEHWLLCAELCVEMPEYEVTIVSYPLAPNSPAVKTLPHMERLYDALEKQARDEDCRITLLGDSSGGNVAIVLGLYAATKFLAEGQAGKCPLRSVFALSPPTDLASENPDIDIAEQHDPLLSRKIITEVAEGWRGDMTFSDPRISPLLADLGLFTRADVRVHGVVGRYDCLAPDVLRFIEKLQAYGVQGEWLDWEKQIHCFPLLFTYHVREGTEGKDWMIDVLRRDVAVL